MNMAMVALLAYSQDQVITRFMYSGGDTNSWLNPPYGVYSSNLVMLENRYEATPQADADRRGPQRAAQMAPIRSWKLLVRLERLRFLHPPRHRPWCDLPLNLIAPHAKELRPIERS